MYGVISLTEFSKMLDKATEAEKKGIPIEKVFKDPKELEVIRICKDILDAQNKEMEED